MEEYQLAYRELRALLPSAVPRTLPGENHAVGTNHAADDDLDDGTASVRTVGGGLPGLGRRAGRR